MKQRLIVSLSTIMLLSGCSEPDSEQARYTRESLQLMDRDCIKRGVEAQMQQAADYSAARLNALGNDAAAAKAADADYPDIRSGLLDDCMQETGNDR